MTRLNNTARDTIRWSGLTIAAYIRDWTGEPDGRTWYGDACGCTDDRCIGHHHESYDDCGCLPVLIRETASRLAVAV